MVGVAERTTTQLLGGKGTRIVRGGCLSIEVAESSGEMVNIEMPWAFDRAKTREDSLKVAARPRAQKYSSFEKRDPANLNPKLQNVKA